MVHKSIIDGHLAVVAIYFDVQEGGNQTSDFIAAWRFDAHNPVVPLVPLKSLIK